MINQGQRHVRTAIAPFTLKPPIPIVHPAPVTEPVPALRACRVLVAAGNARIDIAFDNAILEQLFALAASLLGSGLAPRRGLDGGAGGQLS